MGVIVERRGGTVVAVGGCCHLPFASLTRDGAQVISKHKSDKHPNILTVEDLKLLISEIEKLKDE